MPNDDGRTVNVCETFFTEDPEAECMWPVLGIFLTAEQSLEYGLKRKDGKRGRNPQLDYYQFIRELHDLYVAKTGEKGFSTQSETEPKGPFIDLVSKPFRGATGLAK